MARRGISVIPQLDQVLDFSVFKSCENNKFAIYVILKMPFKTCVKLSYYKYIRNTNVM